MSGDEKQQWRVVGTIVTVMVVFAIALVSWGHTLSDLSTLLPF